MGTGQVRVVVGGDDFAAGRVRIGKCLKTEGRKPVGKAVGGVLFGEGSRRSSVVELGARGMRRGRGIGARNWCSGRPFRGSSTP